MKTSVSASLLAFVILMSCGRERAEQIAASIPVSTDTARVEAVKYTEEELGDVGFERDTVWFPVPDEGYPAKLITVGIFHEDEVWTNFEEDKWFGLFRNGSEYLIKPTKISASRVVDALVDLEGDTTGWKITTEGSDTSLLLVAGLDYLTQRQVNVLKLEKSEILPGDSLHFEFMGAQYELTATGIKLSNGDYPEYANYKLYLRITKGGTTVTQLLTAKPGFDDAMIDILFTGDMDGDGLLDFIIDTSSHYNAFTPTLYLSKPAASGEILKIVGMHVSVGC
jgi:hypothetical protein